MCYYRFIFMSHQPNIRVSFLEVSLPNFQIINCSLQFVLSVLLQFYINFLIFNYQKLNVYIFPKLRKVLFCVTKGQFMCSLTYFLVENIDIVKDETLRLLKNRSKLMIRTQSSGFRHHYRNIYIYIYAIYWKHNAATKGTQVHNMKNSVQEYKNM